MNVRPSLALGALALAAASCARQPSSVPRAGVLDAEGFFASAPRAAGVLASLREEAPRCETFTRPLDAIVCAEAASLDGRVQDERAGWLRALTLLRGRPHAWNERYAWFAAHRLAEAGTVSGPIGVDEATTLDDLARNPRDLGWRTALELRIVRRELRGLRGEEGRRAVGCLGNASVIGPIERAHAPKLEKLALGAFPSAWVSGLARGERRESESEGCELPVGDASQGAPSFLRKGFRLEEERTVIVAVSRASRVFVDGVRVLERSPEVWGSWNRFGAKLRLGAGVHQVTAEVVGSPSAIFVLDQDGLPTPLVAAGPGEPAAREAPRLLEDPNPLEALVQGGIPAEEPAASRFVAAELARADGLDDVAAFWLEGPTSETASPAWLRAQGRAAAADPLYGEEDQGRRSLDFFQHLGKGCPRCLDPRLAHARTLRDGGQPVEAWKALEALATDAPERLDVLLERVDLAERLGWEGERARLDVLLAERFPKTASALRTRLMTADAIGSIDRVRELESALLALGTPPEALNARRLHVRAWGPLLPKAAAATFQELDVLRMAGLRERFDTEAPAVLAKRPEPVLRLALAEEALARGDEHALGNALEAAAKGGESTERLAQAASVVEGLGPLAAYRVDARKVLADFERADKAGFETTGPSSRILDYAVLWVDRDGSAWMLEHEMVRVQSREAIQQEAEQPFPSGRILRLAVRKPDGRVLEPDVVQGKATLTMPDLAIGDVVETEHVQALGAARADGAMFQSPRWFFREPDKSYWRSEYVVVTESDRELAFDERGPVPSRTSRKLPHGRVETRWRVDGAPAVRDEPGAPPRAEWLPSVQVSYGLREADELAHTAERLESHAAIDPRSRRLAEEIVAGVATSQVTERLRRLHAYCLEKIEDGNETFGPRVLTSGTGQRSAAFLHLARILGLPVETALVRTKTAASWTSEAGRLEGWGGALLRAETEQGVRWLTVSERYASFEWLPEVLRGQEAVRLVPGLPRDRVPEATVRDAFVVQGSLEIDDDGSARASLELRFRDRPAMAFRAVRARTDDSEWRRFVEQGLLAASFPSWHTEFLETEGAKDREGDLVVRVRGSAPFWLDARGSRRSPFTINLRPYVALESRQTPLLLETPTGVHVVLRVRGAREARPKAPSAARAVALSNGVFRVDDHLEGDTLILDRTSFVAPERVSPDAYPAWASTLREGLALVEREFAVTLPSRR